MLQNKVMKVSGDNYEIGFKVGERFRAQIADFLKKSKRLKALRKLEKRNPRYEKLTEYGEKYFPLCMKEIKGIADGSNSDLMDILLINCKYDFAGKGCTTVVFKEPNRIVLAHNEDNTQDNLNNCYLLKVYPEIGTSFVSFCYPGMIPGNSFAFNAHGIIMTNNSMPTPDIRIGCPRHLIDRFQLEANDIEDVIRRTLFEERASGGSFNIVSQKEKRAINIETTSRRHCITEVTDKYLHTNHYVSRELGSLRMDESSLGSTKSRYKVGSRLLSRIDEKTPQEALDILSSLEAEPYSILMIDKRRSHLTLFTALFDVCYDRITMKVYVPRPEMQEEDALLELTSDDLT